MAKTGYSCSTEGEVSLTAATAKTVLGVKAGSAVGLDLLMVAVDFDGVTSSAEPVLVEVCYCTWATNSPGTASTGGAERQVYGRVITADFTAGFNWTTEPTTLTVIDPFALDPNKGLYLREYSLGRTYDSAVSEGFALRLTAPANVACRARMEVEHT